MIARWWAIVALLVGWAAIVMWRRRIDAHHAQDAQAAQAAQRRDDSDIDRDELEQAEREVKDIQQDVRGRPLEDVVGDDWGPGTPKPPYV